DWSSDVCSSDLSELEKNHLDAGVQSFLSRIRGLIADADVEAIEKICKTLDDSRLMPAELVAALVARDVGMVKEIVEARQEDIPKFVSYLITEIEKSTNRGTVESSGLAAVQMAACLNRAYKLDF